MQGSFFLLFIAVEVPIIKGERGRVPLAVLIPPYCWPCPKPGSTFITSYIVVGFVFNDLSGNVFY